jgi:NAD-dependent dihydropyrimidine dehydrogenase PreA subunit
VKVVIDYETCEATGVCAQVCPENVFEHEQGRTQVVNPQACTNCWICVDNCVSAAIEIS